MTMSNTHSLFDLILDRIKRDTLATAYSIQQAEIAAREEAQSTCCGETGEGMTGEGWKEVWTEMQADDDRAGIE